MFAKLGISGAARRVARKAGTVLTVLSLGSLLGLPLLLGGCGGGDSADLVLATVGERPITKAYYEERLGKLELADLPRDESGNPLDTSTLSGKKAFLDVIINKELMALKATDMGYYEEGQIAGAEKAMREYHASMTQYNDLFDEPASHVSNEELTEYYSNLGEQRRCSFLIANFREDALKARQEVIDGRLWDDVAEEYHDGAKSPEGSYEVTLQWGRYEDSFEEAIFTLQEGEISQPVETVYGYWLLRLISTERVPVRPLEEMKERVLLSIRQRKIRLRQKEYMAQWHEKYNVEVDESALWIVFQGLPTGEIMLDPLTKKPTPRDELQPLEIAIEDMDRSFYQYLHDGEMQMFTVGDYKLAFDDMNVFQRPKDTEMLGGLRQKIYEAIDRLLILQEAKERGYFEDPRVDALVNPKIEEMVVSKLYSEAVTFEEHVDPDQVLEFYLENKSGFVVPEGRSGRVVYCASEEDAQAAVATAREGKDWAEVLDFFGTDEPNLARGGETDLLRANIVDPLQEALFSLTQLGDVSDPFPREDKWAVVRLDVIEEPVQKGVDEVREEIGQLVRSQRKDRALKELLTQWKDDYGVVIYEDRLGKACAWEDISTEL